MKLQLSSRNRRHAPRVTALAAVATLLFAGFAGVVPAQAEDAPEPPASATQPQTIPSLDSWTAQDGTYVFAPSATITYDGANDQLEGIAQILGEELKTIQPSISTDTGSADAGDIELLMDPSRTDLGAEGYDIEIGNKVTITGAKYSGVFYGTRTLVQWLGQQAELPFGNATDIPQYEERGVTLCACVINISTEFIDRLIEEMSYLKLNTLMVELKVKMEGYPQTNTWSYYTKDDIRDLVAKANAYGIDVIPEINSPGHMEIWLENLPELQLTNQNTGKKDEVRMDITKDESFEFYTDLIDEYSEVFTSKYWHMGMDEYMLGSGYANYPQIKQFAQAQWGANATEDDAVAWYSNKINAYVKSKGKTLRVWNDGIIRNSQVVSFDTDIIVENWNNAASQVAPQTFVDWGHDVVNVSNSLYMVRGSYGINSSGLYNNANWNINTFYNGKITSGFDQVRGARISLWPDGGTPAEAENTTEQRLFEPLRFIAQMTWSTNRPWATYAAFKSAMDEVGRPPLWENAVRQPLPDGAYEVSTPAGSLGTAQDGSASLGSTTESLTFARTSDGYYTIKNSAGQCLDVSRTGTMRLDVPVEIGTGLKFSSCANTTIHRWQVRKVTGGYTIVNAASQQHMSVSANLTNVPVAGKGFKDVSDGLVVQTPADWAATTWRIIGGVSLNAVTPTVTAQNGASETVSLTITNTSGADMQGASVKVTEVPAGWTITPESQSIPTVGEGDIRTIDFVATNVTATGTAAGFGFELVDSTGDPIAQTIAATQSVCSAGSIKPEAIAAVSTEQLSGEPAPNGPAAAAIDGNPGTYWHSAWSPAEAQYPHSIVVDLGSAQEICGLWYTGRSSTGTGGANGRIANYEVYASESVETVSGEWGQALSNGTFENSATAQLASFAPTTARYVKLVALSEVNNNPWATIGELAVAGPYQAPETFAPAVSLDHAEVTTPAPVTVSGSGYAAHEIIKVTVTAEGTADELIVRDARADAQGEFTAQITVPQSFTAGQYQVSATGWASAAKAVTPLAVTVEEEPTNPPEVIPADTQTTITVGASVVGTPTVVTVKVTSAAAQVTGTVKVLEGKKTLTTSAVKNGVATVRISLTPGKHTLVATFTPSDAKAFKASSSAATTVTTAKAKSSIGAKLAAATLTYGKSTSVKVTIASTGNKPTGTVSIMSGTKVLATNKATAASGTVVVKLPKLAVGKHALTVKYSGDANVAQGTAKVGTLTVKKQSTVTSLKVSKSGKTVTAKVEGTVTAAGKVRLIVDGKTISTKRLAQGTVTFTVKKPKAGKHVYQVKYLGDTNSAASSKKVTIKFK